MAEYDGVLFSPPAPVAQVVLRHRETGATWTDVPMLIDTGADITVVPQAALAHLRLTPVPGVSYEVIAFDGRASESNVASLELVFCRRTFRGRFLLGNQPYGVLGRNVLNAVPLLLDGPRLTWAEPAGASPR